MSDNFGKTLELLRKQKKMSRESLAEDICSAKQIQRLEEGKNEPSLYLLNCLSMKLSTNLQDLYANKFSTNHQIGYSRIIRIDELIKKQDVKSLKKELSNITDEELYYNPFLNELFCYANALLEYRSNPELALSYIDKGIKLEYSSKKNTNISSFMFSNTGYTLLNLKAVIFTQQFKYDDSIKLQLEIEKSLKTFYLDIGQQSYISPNFINNIYQVVLCNLIKNLYRTNQKELAKKYLSEGLSFTTEKGTLFNLATLYEYRARILFDEGSINSATEYLIASIITYQTKGQEDYSMKLRNEFSIFLYRKNK